MDHKQLRKSHPELFRLWVRNKFKFGDNPVPQQDKNHIIAIVNESRRCFVVLEYNDGWTADTNEEKTQDINIPSKEIISYQNQEISENNFIALLIDIIKVYSTEELNNQLIICNKTNGPGRVVFDTLRKELFNMVGLDNIRLFPTSRRSKYGKELFTKIGQGWEISASDEKNCFDSMRTSQEQGYFTLATDKSKQAFQSTSNEEQLKLGVEPFMYCWFMLSFIRLSTMNLFD